MIGGGAPDLLRPMSSGAQRVPTIEPTSARGATLTDTPNTTRITEVGTVFVPVSDQERALAFYVGVLGFETRVDFVYGAEKIRWIELAPPGAANTISLVPPAEGVGRGGDETFCAFATNDIEAVRAALRASGTELDAEVAPRERAGRASSRSRRASAIRCRRSASSATRTGTASCSCRPG